MSVRKRQWVTGKGEPREAWVVDYVDTAGKRRLKTFTRKKKADAFAATSKVEVADGTGVVTLTASARAFSRRMPPFMPPLLLAAIAPSPRRGTGGVSSGKSNDVGR